MKIALITGLLMLSLAGCHNDPRPPQYRAKVIAAANKVCVLVQPEVDENVVIVKIEEVGNPEHNFQKYDITDMKASPDKCVSSYGYHFIKGHSYNFTVYLESPEKRRNAIIPASRIFSIGFAVRDNNGNLEVFRDN